MTTARDVLKNIWGYPAFRPLQEEIVESVLDGKETIALLPTGGGKSICFQVPAMMMDGICIVITPLIALMKDQVHQLQRRGIRALALHSGMSRKEIDIALDNCAYGEIKFLYVSPERLKTDLFRKRVEKLQISLLAIDEAHCISQWGYDFRPPYLEIGDFRKEFEIEKVIALTATATPEVKKDIALKLALTEPVYFEKSFARPNLSYSCFSTERKDDKLLHVLQNTHGSAVVYAGTRKRTKEISFFLQQHGIDSEFYHAGLNPAERDTRQHNWITGNVRVIVATNAFGMGIDKPDVRIVVHMDLPLSLEAYYQEAGRAGRDEEKAYAVMIYSPADIDSFLSKVEKGHADIELIKRTYQALANRYRLAVGSGGDTTYDFDYHAFVENFNLPMVETFQALRKLEEEGLIRISEGVFKPSIVHFNIEKEELYRFQVSHAKLDPLVKGLLRLYGGELFTQFVPIKENDLAKYLKLDYSAVLAELKLLDEMDILDYQRGTDKPQLIFSMPRIDANNLPVDAEKIKWRIEVDRKKANQMIEYATESRKCRTRMLQAYFGEMTDRECGVCDYCVEKRRKPIDRKVLMDNIPESGIDIELLAHKLDVHSSALIAKIREDVEDGNLQIRENSVYRS